MVCMHESVCNKYCFVSLLTLIIQDPQNYLTIKINRPQHSCFKEERIFFLSLSIIKKYMLDFPQSQNQLQNKDWNLKILLSILFLKYKNLYTPVEDSGTRNCSLTCTMYYKQHDLCLQSFVPYVSTSQSCMSSPST